MGCRIAPSGQEQVRGPDTHKPAVLPSAVGVGGTRRAEGSGGTSKPEQDTRSHEEESQKLHMPREYIHLLQIHPIHEVNRS